MEICSLSRNLPCFECVTLDTHLLHENQATFNDPQNEIGKGRSSNVYYDLIMC